MQSKDAWKRAARLATNCNALAAIIGLAIVPAPPAAAQRPCAVTLSSPTAKPAEASAKRSAVFAEGMQLAAIVNGGGIGLLTDPDGQTFSHQFSIGALVNSDGTARGQANFVFSRAFSLKWGAVPGVSEIIHLQGEITSGSTSTDGTVVLTGPFIETDFASGEGLVYREDSRESGSAPLRLVVSPASNSFTLDWCAFIPPNGMGSFSIQVVKGNLKVHRPPQ